MEASQTDLPKRVEDILDNIRHDYRTISIQTIEQMSSVGDRPHPGILDLSSYCYEVCDPEAESGLSGDEKKELLDQIVSRLTSLITMSNLKRTLTN